MKSEDYFKTDDNGRTILLFHAAVGNKAEVEKIIFSLAGTGISCQRLALITYKDNDGLVAADLAARNDHDEIEILFRAEQGRMEFFK